MSALRWKNGSLQRPTSICSEPCLFGQSKINTSECCWMCVSCKVCPACLVTCLLVCVSSARYVQPVWLPICWSACLLQGMSSVSGYLSVGLCVSCKDNEFLDEAGQCKSCPSDSQPNATLTGCERLPIVTLVPTSLWFVLPVTFSLAGVMCTIFTFGVFLVFNKTPFLVASGRELCYILLFGISISYITSVAMLARPSMFTCLIRRFALGVSLCFVYAAILTKTNRIFRIFSVGIKAMVKRPSYTSPKSQIFICLALVSVQVVGAFTWLGFEKPDVILTHHQKGQLVLRCRASQIATIVSLLYNIFLIILCTVYAFKTRKIPQNFNEAKYIAFTMYSTCIVWVAFVPIYFGANHDFKCCHCFPRSRVTSLCMCVNISATVALFCLFAPKVYIVLLQPHKNVRQTSAASLSTSGKATTRNFYDPSTASTGLSGGGVTGRLGRGEGVYQGHELLLLQRPERRCVLRGTPANPLPFLTPKPTISPGSHGLPGTTVAMTTTQASLPPQQHSPAQAASARDFRKRNSTGHVILYTPPSPSPSCPYPGLVVHPSPTYYGRDPHSMDNEIIEEDEDIIEEEKRNMFHQEEEEEEEGEEEAGEQDGMIPRVASSPSKFSRGYEDANGAGVLSRLSDVTSGFPERNHYEGKRPHMVPMCRHSCHTHPLPPLDDWGREDAEDSSSCDEARPARMLVTDIS
ncbi:hypothetical protein RRG08_066579 [Elysia crispata]|uniref:G-protein coupled receptors family 3 profile domain-containing protein n=1 Tax=Elysia crispata TaxID=231223 RepID=A0AAE0XZX4_9GAST|nr:hypothetical protein RRG08_066579 [Elysia crispata]